MTRVAVLGPGGVGGFVAATLTRAGVDVVVVAREPTAEVLAERGLEVTSTALDARFAVRLPVVARLHCRVDYLLVATKAGGLGEALSRVATEPGLVVPLLNGLEHMAVLRERFGERHVAAAVIRIETDRPEPGRIVQTSPSVRVDLADTEPEQSRAVRELASVLDSAGIPTLVQASESQVLWSKLARLNALSLTTSASDRQLGFVRSDPRWRSALEGAVNETVAVANADGATLAAADTMAELDRAPAELGSSMRRDIAAGRPPELDALAGAVLRAGARHEVRCPTVSWLAGRVARRAGIAPPHASAATP